MQSFYILPMNSLKFFQNDFHLNKQECITVGCVPSTAVAVWGVSTQGDGGVFPGVVCIPTCTGADTPCQPEPSTSPPMGVGLDTPTQPDPSTCPPGCGLDTPYG